MKLGTSPKTKSIEYDGGPGPSVLLAVLAVLLLTLTLRVPVTSVAPVAPAIGADHGLGTTALSLLTSLPLVCFVLVAPFVPRLLGGLGMWRLLAFALMAAVAGSALRSVPGTIWLAFGTLVLGCAVAVASVLAPAVVRQLRPASRTTLTAIYSAGLSLGPAMATGLTIPAAQLLGDSWRLALALWSVVPLAALVLWACTRSSRHMLEDDVSAPPVRFATLLREPAAWGVTAYLGISSLLFYTNTAWVPTILQEAGQTPQAAGATATLVSLIAIPAALVVPALTRHPFTARGAAIVAPLSVTIALVLLSLTDDTGATYCAMILLGVGQGASVGMAYTIVVAITRSAGHAAALSSMSLTVGVTLAAIGPLALGASREALDSWVPGLLGAAAIGAAQAIVGVYVSRAFGRRTVTDTEPTR